ncbi:hypothetical protein GCM10010121_029140 [Streptomyces brasiliensis]|uniref:Transmembrane protein n=1 Tax=Streptomyces brasiliensis TaxID=1954 RepID=A0A917NPI9_9ACTN|nr:hypothetical protein GCM10010121_029140 [Streptomyces brasiliensis]
MSTIASPARRRAREDSVNVASPSPFYSFSAGIMLVELLVVPVLHTMGDKARQYMARWDDFRSRELIADDRRTPPSRSDGT